jgi:effector-binding domain-containing protein
MKAFWFLLMIAISPAAFAEPTTKPSDVNDFGVMPVRVQDFKPRTYLSITMTTTLNDIAPTVAKAMAKMKELLQEGHVRPAGPAMLIYKGITHDPEKQFDLQVGFIVPDDTKDTGEAKVQKLEPFHAAVIIYSGPIASVPEAWRQLYTQIAETGMQPTNEAREEWLAWEGPDSTNNVQRIAAGVK